jgi:hypothetical protein
LITGLIFTYVEEKDLLKMNNDSVWRGPAQIQARPEKRYSCQSDCIVVHFGYTDESRDKTKILEGFSNKKDKDNEQQYSEFVEKYVRPPSPQGLEAP